MYIVKCKIADFNVVFESDIKALDKIMRDYLFDFEEVDMVLRISEEDIIAEINGVEEEKVQRFLTSFKIAAFSRKFADELHTQGAVVYLQHY